MITNITALANAILPLLTAGLTGWLCGAFVNYASDVLPLVRRLRRPVCVHCHAGIPWLNYLLYPRQCLSCGKHRSLRSWVVELLFVAVGIWLWRNVPEGWTFWAGMILLVYFSLITVIDIEHRLILHSVSIAGALLGLALGAWQHGLVPTLIGGAAGFLAMFGLYWLGRLFIRYQKRRQGLETPEDALGFGDVNLGGVIGLLLGWPGIIVGLVFAILLGGAFSLAYLVFKLFRREYRSSLAIPYGPFLAASAVWLLIFRGAVG